MQTKERIEQLKRDSYWLAKWQTHLFNGLNNFKKERGLSSSDLAKILGVTKGYVSQILNGNFDHKASKLIELSLAIGKAPIFELQDLESYIEKDPSEL